jgi:hypothetical protein
LGEVLAMRSLWRTLGSDGLAIANVLNESNGMKVIIRRAEMRVETPVLTAAKSWLWLGNVR